MLPAELAGPLAQVMAAQRERVLPSYPGWTNAAGAFAGEVSAEFEGVRPDDVLRAGARESASRRPGALADLMIRHSRLPVLLTDPGRAAAFRNELAGNLAEGFAGLADLPTARAAGLQLGERIAAGAIEKVRTAEQFFTQMAEFGGVAFERGIASATGAVGAAQDHEQPGTGPWSPGAGRGKDRPAGRE